MDKDKQLVLETAEQEIEKIERATKSKQPRLTADAEGFFSSVYKWVMEESLTIPPYATDSRNRDTWLRSFWMKEPHFAGVLNDIALIDANRGWNLIGGRNQVNRYIDVAHGLEDGKGWRYYHRIQSLANRTADIGAVHEIGRDGRYGPLRMLWTVDPARCRNTGKLKTPLGYSPQDGSEQMWLRGDYFKTVSMPSTDEALRGLGFCATSRAYEIAKTMIAIYQHDHEMLGSSAPRGLLLLKNISQNQWETAMQARDVEMTSKDYQYYGALAVLAGMGTDDVDAKLIALSQLPQGFDRAVFTDLLMFAYALVTGFPPEEFWVVRGGSLGRGQESEIQQRMATAKGVMDYPATFQEDYQKLLPATLQFEFEERDVEGELIDAEVRLAQTNVVNAMYGAGMGVIDREEARYLLAENGLIPQEWTEAEEPVMADDEDIQQSRKKRDMKEQLLERYRHSPQVQRAAYYTPNEPIVRYSWPTNKIVTLWERGQDVNPKRLHRARRIVRQEEGETLYQGDDFTITDQDVNRAIDQGIRRVGAEFGELLDNEPIQDDEA